MNLYEFRSVYRPNSIKPLIAVLDELEYEFSYIAESFQIVRRGVERNIYANIKEWTNDLYKSHNPRLNICIAINNIAYAHLQSGQYHGFRGEIAAYGPGEGLVELYKFSSSELIRLLD
jgi:hypothetical protein